MIELSINPKLTSHALVALWCLPALAFAAPPTITNVSGTVQTGETLTITGTNMVQEDTTNWDPLFIRNAGASGFEGTSPTADGYQNTCRGTFVDPNGARLPRLNYTTAVKLMGNQSLHMFDSGQNIRRPDGTGMGGCAWQWVVEASRSRTAQNWPDVYLRAYSRWSNTSWPNKDVKYWWIQDARQVNPGPGYFMSFRTRANGSPPTRFGICAPKECWIEGSIPGGPMKNDRWYLFEAHFRTQEAGNYIVEMWIDNQLILSRAVSTGANPNGSAWGWESNTNYYDTPVGWVSNQWQDGFAVSKTRVGPASLIEIGNSPDYARGKKLYQEPLLLSDGSSQIKADLTGLDPPYYLWVTNNRGERIQPAVELKTASP